MSQFDDREKGEEARFVMTAELEFKAHARCNKLLGIWAAELMSLAGDEARAYAADVVAADFAESGDEDVFKKVSADLKAKGLTVPDAVIRQKIAQLASLARQQIMSEG
ncbi:MAG: DUF1476 domain-containing protein [Devosia sp.]|nr:DUF1476 domain-containing protein [Devosia sp.]